MDLATLIKPILTAGELRVIGSTTFEEFKHIEKDRALARRLQKIAIEEPSIEETVRILGGLRKRYEEHHASRYTDAALEAAAKLAARHLRDYRLPDSAIDLHRRSRRGVAAARRAPARPCAERQAGRSRTHGRAGSSEPRSARKPPSRKPPALSVVDAADIERVVARMARIPARQASSSDRERLRTLEESLERVVFGQDEAVQLVGAGDQAIARRPRACRSGRPAASCSPGRPASARPSSPSSSRCSSATSSSAST